MTSTPMLGEQEAIRSLGFSYARRTEADHMYMLGSIKPSIKTFGSIMPTAAIYQLLQVQPVLSLSNSRLHTFYLILNILYKVIMFKMFN